MLFILLHDFWWLCMLGRVPCCRASFLVWESSSWQDALSFHKDFKLAQEGRSGSYWSVLLCTHRPKHCTTRPVPSEATQIFQGSAHFTGSFDKDNKWDLESKLESGKWPQSSRTSVKSACSGMVHISEQHGRGVLSQASFSGIRD